MRRTTGARVDETAVAGGLRRSAHDVARLSGSTSGRCVMTQQGVLDGAGGSGLYGRRPGRRALQRGRRVGGRRRAAQRGAVGSDGSGAGRRRSWRDYAGLVAAGAVVERVGVCVVEAWRRHGDVVELGLTGDHRALLAHVVLGVPASSTARTSNAIERRHHTSLPQQLPPGELI